ncbi:MAG: alpha/beta hydrolase, partial [Metallosphaera sp.]
MSERYFEIRGKKIRYIDNNVKGNRKLILFHGARFNANTWLTTGTLQYLETEGIPSLAVDFPGYGKSETGWDDLAEFIKDLIAESELETPVLLGPSMGGNAVLRYALRYDRVSGLVLVGAVGVKEVEKDI